MNTTSRVRRPGAPELDSTKVARTGTAAIVAGVLFGMSNLFGEYLLPAEQHGDIRRIGLFLVYVAAYGLGAIALVYALRGLRIVFRDRIARTGAISLQVAAIGAGLQALFAAVYFATAAATGDPADSAFFLFALGFLLLIVGCLTAGGSMIRRQRLRRVGLLLLLTAAAAIVIIVTPAPAHAVGLLVYYATWIVIGLDLVSRKQFHAQPHEWPDPA